MVSDQEFSTEFIAMVEAGDVPGWRRVMVKDPHPNHAGQMVPVLVDEAGPVAQAWLLAPDLPTLLPGFVVGHGCNVTKEGMA